MNKVIILSNKNCRLETEDTALLYKLKSALSYVQEGFEYSVAHKEHGWDGKVCLISNKRNDFNYPLLDRVTAFFKEENEPLTIEDKRKVQLPVAPQDISARLKELNLVPRDYQQDVVDKVKSKNVGIMRLCTGAGKTLLSALLTAEVNKPTLVMVIGIDLMYQFHELYSQIFPDEKIGMIGNGICEVGPRINIATIWTLGIALKVPKADLSSDEIETQDETFEESNVDKILGVLESSKAFHLDECHVAGTKTLKNIYKKIDPENFYGLSGTPFRDGEDDLAVVNFLGEKIADISATELIRKGVLPQPIIKFINVPATPIFGRTYPEIYKEYIVENDIRNAMVYANTKELLDKKYCVLVLFKTIAHGKTLFDLFKKNKIKCMLLSGKDNIAKRDAARDALNAGKIDVIIASTIFDLGINIPKLSAMILASGGKSYIRALQRAGRLLRSYPGKTNVAIVEFMDNARYLKNHSRKRLEIYQQEPGFKLILPKNMK